MNTIKGKMEEFQERDSGWTLVYIDYLEVNFNCIKTLRGSSYTPLPLPIQKKKACVNVKNQDQACFAWAVLSALYPRNKNSDRVSSYPNYKDGLNIENINFPVCSKDIIIFEKNNNLSINVYGLMKKTKLLDLYTTLKIRNKPT